MQVYYSLYGRLLNKHSLLKGFQKVRKAKGAPGVDGQTLVDFAKELDKNLTQLLEELQMKTYQALPVLRVEIPKDDGGIRLLGIPAVRDRIVQQALAELLEPIFDPDFHPSSYGYRKGRGTQQAIAKATLFIRTYNRQHVVDMDLSKCFDKLDHGLILASVKRRVTDSSILELIRKFLTSGVMENGHWQASNIGSPQGGVISPLLANIYLDAFDQAMKERGHRIIRYADDILILCESRKAAESAERVATKLLEQELKLTVNRTKTHIAHSDEGIKYLGVEIGSAYTRIQSKKLSAFKKKLKQMTKRRSGRPLHEIIDELNPLLRGFSQYFRIANASREFRELAKWLRRRLRSIQLRLWKKPGRLYRRLRQLGYNLPFIYVDMCKWRTSCNQLAHYAMPNRWFEELGLYAMDKVKVGVLPERY